MKVDLGFKKKLTKTSFKMLFPHFSKEGLLLIREIALLDARSHTALLHTLPHPRMPRPSLPIIQNHCRACLFPKPFLAPYLIASSLAKCYDIFYL